MARSERLHVGAWSSGIWPTDGTVLGVRTTVNLIARAADETALQKVSISVNGTSICTVNVVANTDVNCIYRSPRKPGRSLSISATATDAAGYIRESILTPSAHLVPGAMYSAGGRSFMPDNFRATLTPKQIEQLVAYLLTLP